MFHHYSNRAVILITLILINISTSSAKSIISLFTKVERSYIQSSEYNNLVKEENLKKGDIITIGDYRFKYTGYIGQGTTCRILKVQSLSPHAMRGEYALRIPLATGIFEGHTPYRKYISSIIQGEKLLHEENIRIPEVILGELDTFSLSPVEKFNLKIPFFLQNPDEITSRISRYDVEESFLQLAEKLYLFEKVGDFQIAQLTYDSKKKEVILMDWINAHKTALRLDSKITPFDNILFESSLKFKYDKDSELILERGRPVRRNLSTWEQELIRKAKLRIINKRVRFKAELTTLAHNLLDQIRPMNIGEELVFIEDTLSPQGYTRYEIRLFKQILKEEQRKLGSKSRVSINNYGVRNKSTNNIRPRSKQANNICKENISTIANVQKILKGIFK